MERFHVTSFEHDSLAVGDTELGISTDEADRLSNLAEARPGFCIRGYGTVRLSQYCGVVSLGARALEVLPKVESEMSPESGRALLLRLLRRAEASPFFRHVDVGHRVIRAPLLDLFIAAFFDSVMQVVRGGLLQEYREYEDDLRVVRGRIVAGRQFAVHANRTDLLACRFDDLTIDNAWNRAIRVGLRSVRPWIVGADLQRRCIELLAVFGDVADANGAREGLTDLVFDRKSTRYRAAIEWVRRILAVVSPSLRVGANPAPGMLFDMNVLFQSAIAAMLRRAVVDPALEVRAQATGVYLASVVDNAARCAIALRPDIVLIRRAARVAIADTKWKPVDVDRHGYLQPDPADVYQLLAYAAAMRCRDLALIYPWHDALRGSRETIYELPEVGGLRPRLNVICVDLTDDALPARRGASTPGFGPLLASARRGASQSGVGRN